MDVNGLPFWQLCGRSDFGLSPETAADRAAIDLNFSDEKGHLSLARQQAAPQLSEDEIFARRMVSSPSPVADGLGGFGWWDRDAERVEASGFLPGNIAIAIAGEDAPDFASPSDMTTGSDEILYLASGGAVIMHDLRDRWPDAKVERDDFAAHLLAAAPGGGVWAFDRAGRKLARITGRPLRFSGITDEDPGKFGPQDPNPDPPRMIVDRRAAVSSEFDVVAMAASPSGRLALLAWDTGEDALILLLGEDGFEIQGRLAGLAFPFSLAWQGDDALAVLASDGAAIARQAYVYDMRGAATPERALLPDGRVFPLLDPWQGKFANIAGPQAQHLCAKPGGKPHTMRPLHSLSGGNYARQGKVLIGPIDSGRAGTIWHRLYAEAALSSGGAIQIQLLASDQPDIPDIASGPDDADWAMHVIGRTAAAPQGNVATPRAAWLPQASEIGGAESSLSCPVRVDEAGLFTLLMQNSGSRVRRLSGRYLWITLGMSGNGLGSPELSALRIYAGRQSLRDRYLPAFYHEQLTGSDAEQSGPATRHDFLERMLESFEGSLTEIEGRIANGWKVTDPAAAPDAALPWIGDWIAEEIDLAEAPARARERLLAAPYCRALHGTQGGLMAALELATGGRVLTGGQFERGAHVPPPGSLAIAKFGDAKLRGLLLATAPGGGCVVLTGGGVTRGDIVVVEGFRLRRTFATILGADLVDEEDPLTLGTAVSGNSLVGDTLILGEKAGRELFALYREEIDTARRDARAVEQFYARLAWRVLVLLRGTRDRSEYLRLKQVAEANVPAHVEAQLFAAQSALIVGAASLVGIDSYLSEKTEFERVQLNRSLIGEGDFVAGSGQLDARADGPVPIPPIARADGPGEVWRGGSFTLSALASTAAGGRHINRHIWMWDKEE